MSSFWNIFVSSSFVYFVVPEIKMSDLNFACISNTSLNNLLTLSISFASALLTVMSIVILLLLYAFPLHLVGGYSSETFIENELRSFCFLFLYIYIASTIGQWLFVVNIFTYILYIIQQHAPIMLHICYLRFCIL